MGSLTTIWVVFVTKDESLDILIAGRLMVLAMTRGCMALAGGYLSKSIYIRPEMR